MPAPPHQDRADPRAGFSLIEQLVVLVILGLIVGVVVISYRAVVPNEQKNAAIRNLSEHLASARSEAIARGAAFEMIYDLDAERYWVRSPYRLGGGFAAEDDEQRVLLHETDLTQNGMQIAMVKVDDREYTDGPVFVRFDPLGATSAHTVVLHHTLFESDYTIEVLPLTGEIRMHDGWFERELAEEGDFD